MCAKIITIANQKGGVGKTTTAVNLATAIAAVGKNTLLIDLDPQGNASTGLGIEQKERQPNIYNILIESCSVEDAIKTTQIPHLHIIPSKVELSAAEVELINIENWETRLQETLGDVANNYDFIIIDTPPSLGVLTVNTLVMADSVLIPLQCEFYALEGLSHLLQTIELVKNNLNDNLKIEGVLLTMYDRRNKLTSDVENDVRNYLGSKVFQTVIPRNVKVSEAPSFGKPAIIYDFSCHGSAAYVNFAKEFLGKYRASATAC